MRKLRRWKPTTSESRLLQRDVDVGLSEGLLKEGMAKCVDWSIAKVGKIIFEYFVKTHDDQIRLFVTKV